jgi:tetratricopeptide (TPR) repeat protein
MAEPRLHSTRHASPAQRALVHLPRAVAGEIRQAAGALRAQDAAAAAERALSLLEEGEAERAVEAARRAKGLASRSASVREILALAHYQAGQWRDALREMQAYRRMSGRLDQNHVIADCFRALGKPERAVPEAEQTLTADVPDEVRAECAVVGASALADMGRLESALAFVRRVPSRGDVGRPFDLRLWYVAGDILARLGRTAEAEREFERILRHDPRAFDTAERLAALRGTSQDV